MQQAKCQSMSTIFYMSSMRDHSHQYSIQMHPNADVFLKDAETIRKNTLFIFIQCRKVCLERFSAHSNSESASVISFDLNFEWQLLRGMAGNVAE